MPAASASAPTPKASAITPIPMPPARLGMTTVESFDDPPPLPLKKGMPYGEARAKLLAQGWRPIHNPYCVMNILVGLFGEDDFNHYKGTCKPGNEAEVCQTCSDFPEIRGCTGDSHCSVTFGYGAEWIDILIWPPNFRTDGIKEGFVSNWGSIVVAPYGSSTRSVRHRTPKK
jgi:hypothetical protein